jgi:DNA-binding transcriptional regulator YhcF (GntR family)
VKVWVLREHRAENATIKKGDSMPDKIFHIKINKKGQAPLYQQLADGLAKLIAEGSLPPDSQLPPIRKMAEEYGVNNVTVVSAYKNLESKQMV